MQDANIRFDSDMLRFRTAIHPHQQQIADGRRGYRNPIHIRIEKGQHLVAIRLPAIVLDIKVGKPPRLRHHDRHANTIHPNPEYATLMHERRVDPSTGLCHHIGAGGHGPASIASVPGMPGKPRKFTPLENTATQSSWNRFLQPRYTE
jgi:hypothetical protein